MGSSPAEADRSRRKMAAGGPAAGEPDPGEQSAPGRRADRSQLEVSGRLADPAAGRLESASGQRGAEPWWLLVIAVRGASQPGGWSPRAASVVRSTGAYWLVRHAGGGRQLADSVAWRASQRSAARRYMAMASSGSSRLRLLMAARISATD